MSLEWETVLASREKNMEVGFFMVEPTSLSSRSKNLRTKRAQVGQPRPIFVSKYVYVSLLDGDINHPIGELPCMFYVTQFYDLIAE